MPAAALSSVPGGQRLAFTPGARSLNVLACDVVERLSVGESAGQWSKR